ncbi:PFL_4703 family integrating conjugative element protein [Vibrio barjaei]|uniref:PFL_4703 family integrating conjugative element protein n=1 Tax=Vibrio barjaei TaxID=1676683 RepID=UPI00228458A0|nr:TIGR03746 family integrating conjugative element protein [Vibrio barjaei]MCY9874547.1 TIGR03746 family integrating conjugative element protein [Vibrio barjaei]
MVSIRDELKNHIQTLRVVIIFLLAGLLFSVHGNVTMTDKITVHIPPDLRGGASMAVGEIPPSNIFLYASYLWLEANTWMKSGETDALVNLDIYSEYFSPKFVESLKKDITSRQERRDLDRQRRLTMVPGSTFEISKRVVKVTRDSWIVYLDVVDEEFYLGERVKNSTIRYALKLERFDVPVSRNPLGVRVTGFAERPKLLGEL